jgi:hypothetical protein
MWFLKQFDGCMISAAGRIRAPDHAIARYLEALVQAAVMMVSDGRTQRELASRVEHHISSVGIVLESESLFPQR